jgi:hypothetical protein
LAAPLAAVVVLLVVLAELALEAVLLPVPAEPVLEAQLLDLAQHLPVLPDKVVEVQLPVLAELALVAQLQLLQISRQSFSAAMARSTR